MLKTQSCHMKTSIMNQMLVPVERELHAPILSNPMPNMWSQPRFHTSQEWEDQRSEITRLYLTENKPLKDIIETMENEYSFCATCVAAQLSITLRRTYLIGVLVKDSTRPAYLNGRWRRM